MARRKSDEQMTIEKATTFTEEQMTVKQHVAEPVVEVDEEDLSDPSAVDIINRLEYLENKFKQISRVVDMLKKTQPSISWSAYE